MVFDVFAGADGESDADQGKEEKMAKWLQKRFKKQSVEQAEPKTRTCPRCGFRELKEKDNYCNQCGINLRKEKRNEGSI